MLKLILPAAAMLMALAACSPPAAQTPVPANGSMQMSAAPATSAQSGPIMATGTVTGFDAATGAITIEHQPINSINWPAMTMQFHAENPSVLQGVAVGDHVTFQLKSASEPQVVTMLQKQ